MDTEERRRAVESLLARRVQNVFPSREDVVRRLASSERLTIYWGIDPTGADVHIGHTVPLLVLRDLAKLKHDTVVLIGDFTARIGDPTDKSATRVQLTTEQVQSNMATYLAQVGKIIPADAFRVAYNTEWLSTLTLEQTLTLMSMATVQQMIQRDMFQERLKHDKPIHLSEFLYPLMQGYDSVALRADGEIGGNDQTFNMLMGRDLERTLLEKDKFVLATYLLADTTTGRKMSKSEGELIALTDSPQEIRRKVLALDDAVTATVFRLCTDKPMEWIDERERATRSGENQRDFKEELAAELVRMYHGQEAVSEAAEAAPITATGPLDQVLKKSGLAASLSEAKRLIDQRGVLVNGQVAERWDAPIGRGDVIRVGKGKFAKVV